mmetsp:Transcript_77054/g.231186  ORF Transcript_77054/g.231186 Transcript_77054/m.231186 type:complete len:225 (-) Transcript_77054:350-1024(-)
MLNEPFMHQPTPFHHHHHIATYHRTTTAAYHHARPLCLSSAPPPSNIAPPAPRVDLGRHERGCANTRAVDVLAPVRRGLAVAIDNALEPIWVLQVCVAVCSPGMGTTKPHIGVLGLLQRKIHGERDRRATCGHDVRLRLLHIEEERELHASERGAGIHAQPAVAVGPSPSVLIVAFDGERAATDGPGAVSVKGHLERMGRIGPVWRDASAGALTTAVARPGLPL